jgi:hypothetical protein
MTTQIQQAVATMQKLAKSNITCYLVKKARKVAVGNSNYDFDKSIAVVEVVFCHLPTRNASFYASPPYRFR